MELDYKNYHEKIKHLIEEDIHTIDDKEERKQVYDAADYYAKDRLLLEIAVNLSKKFSDKVNTEFSHEKDYDKDSRFSIEVPLGKTKMKKLEVIIQGSIKGKFKKFSIPFHYLTKLSYVFYKRNLIHGLHEVESRFEKQEKQCKDLMEYFIQYIIPEFRHLGIEALKVIFDIEYIVLKNMDEKTKETASHKGKYIKFDKIIKQLKHDDKEKLKDIRDDILHESMKDIFEKKDEYIRIIDAVAKELHIKNDLSTRLKQAEERRKEQRREGIKKYQMSKNR